MPIYEWDEDTQTLVLQNGLPDHRSKWACFECRKSFTRIRQKFGDRVVCPDCGRESVDMGHLFEPPPKRDLRSWRLMKVLADFGVRFYRASSVVFIRHFMMEDGMLSPKALRAKLEEGVAASKRGSHIGLHVRR